MTLLCGTDRLRQNAEYAGRIECNEKEGRIHEYGIYQKAADSEGTESPVLSVGKAGECQGEA